MDTRGEWLKAELCMIVVADMRIFGYIGSASCLLWVPYCSCNIHIFTIAIAILLLPLLQSHYVCYQLLRYQPVRGKVALVQDHTMPFGRTASCVESLYLILISVVLMPNSNYVCSVSFISFRYHYLYLNSFTFLSQDTWTFTHLLASGRAKTITGHSARMVPMGLEVQPSFFHLRWCDGRSNCF